MTFITLDSVAKTFMVDDGEVQALASFSLGIGQGEFVSLVGPSGCGKSTLLRIVAGLIPPSSGEACIQDRPIRAPSPDIGIVFQQPVLLPWMSVIENVLLPARIAGGRKDEYRKRAQDLLYLVGLEGFGDRAPMQLSGGMQQRAAICRALILKPKILLMDEPFGALDAITRDEMGIELQRIWSEVGATVLFVTHSIPEAVFLSDRVVVMSPRPGRIVESLDVDLPRPRTLNTFTSPRFAELGARIRTIIESAVQVNRQQNGKG